MEEILSIPDNENKGTNTLDISQSESITLDLNPSDDGMLDLIWSEALKPKKSFSLFGFFKKKEKVIQESVQSDDTAASEAVNDIITDQTIPSNSPASLQADDNILTDQTMYPDEPMTNATTVIEEILSVPENENYETVAVDMPQNENYETVAVDMPQSEVSTLDLNQSDDILDLNWSETINPKKSLWLFGFFKKKEKVIQESAPADSTPVQSDNNSITDQSISLDNSMTNADIFQELELGGLDFWGQPSNHVEKAPFEPLVFTLQLTWILFWITLFWLMWFYMVVFARGTNSDFIAKMPLVCDYIWSTVDWYENSECKTLNQMVESFKKEKSNIETTLIQELSILIPEKIKTNYILSSPKVKFIQETTWNSRISIAKVLEDFENIRKSSWWYQWKNIECNQYNINEKWELSVNCDFYGASINESEDTALSMSSRWVALDFLKNLQSKNSSFSISDYPKNIEISKFNWWEDIKVIFSTKTSLMLKLKYYPLSAKS
ncbi:MAG: hypothetical protein ACD_2C00038G0001 [uncultured bacterium (gcode 4)]|uniref:Uncharacterized protein n=1 Tax=uncultured bacterium (gcode 4) TaxID=1234023 RepID=K2GI50_9BACT|nr:MAG: hypothetical protein ACD_2C00038G0001 [uncultured bacterium (gcode 4)]